MSNLAEKMDMEPELASEPTLRTLVIPYRGGLGVLPNNLVVEVLPYAPPLGLEDAPSWVLGTMLWKAITLPLISVEFLVAGDERPESGAHNRIIVVSAVNAHPKVTHYGFVGAEAPRMLELRRDDVANEIFLKKPPEGVANQVLVQGERGVIPDVDLIESTMSGLLTAQRAR